MELDLIDTIAILESLFKDALPHFDFPRFRINKHDMSVESKDCGFTGMTYRGGFIDTLTMEEKDIIAKLMLQEWLRRQLHSTKVTQMKYSTADFRMTSQAAHMQRLNALISSLGKEIYRMQRMYRRRREDEDGYIVPNYHGLSTSGKSRTKRIHTPLGEVVQD